MKSKKVIFLFGPPASGKDTQARLLAKKFKGKRITTSEVLKKFFRKKKRYLILQGKKINLAKEKEKYHSGNLVNFHLVVYLIIEKIKKEKGTIIFAGSPRSVVEAKAEYSFLKTKKIPVKFIYLKVPFQVAFQRALGRQRKDAPLDMPEIFKRRWYFFEKHTLPARNFLVKRGTLLEIDGSKSVREIHQAILFSLQSF